MQHFLLIIDDFGEFICEKRDVFLKEIQYNFNVVFCEDKYHENHLFF